jgi:hypothetical protein
MGKRQARLLAALACILTVTAGCSTFDEPQSGTDTRTRQDRDRTNNPADGMNRGGGGGY